MGKEGPEKQVMVGGALLQGARILLCRRAPDRPYYPGVWDVPGGHVHAAETEVEGLVRELEEELGVVPTRFVKLATVSESLPDGHGPSECHIYGVLAWAGTPCNLQSEEHSEVRWFSWDETLILEWVHPGLPKVLKAFVDLYGDAERA